MTVESPKIFKKGTGPIYKDPAGPRLDHPVRPLCTRTNRHPNKVILMERNQLTIWRTIDAESQKIMTITMQNISVGR